MFVIMDLEWELRNKAMPTQLAAMPVDVYHINKVTQPGETVYHKQHRLFISMTDTIKYIQQHDKCLTPV